MERRQAHGDGTADAVRVGGAGIWVDNCQAPHRHRHVLSCHVVRCASANVASACRHGDRRRRNRQHGDRHGQGNGGGATNTSGTAVVHRDRDHVWVCHAVLLLRGNSVRALASESLAICHQRWQRPHRAADSVKVHRPDVAADRVRPDALHSHRGDGGESLEGIGDVVGRGVVGDGCRRLVAVGEGE